MQLELSTRHHHGSLRPDSSTDGLFEGDPHPLPHPLPGQPIPLRPRTCQHRPISPSVHRLDPARPCAKAERATSTLPLHHRFPPRQCHVRTQTSSRDHQLCLTSQQAQRRKHALLALTLYCAARDLCPASRPSSDNGKTVDMTRQVRNDCRCCARRTRRRSTLPASSFKPAWPAQQDRVAHGRARRRAQCSRGAVGRWPERQTRQR